MQVRERTAPTAPRVMDDEDVAALDVYLPELAESGVLSRIDHARREFASAVSGRTSRGDSYDFGGLRPEPGNRLYGLVRGVAPTVCVETGVCNGVSTALILAALERNGVGRLHSIDLPERAGTPYPDGTFWRGKKGAVVPTGKDPGWVVAPHLRRRWTLTIGRSQDVLVALLDALGTIDFFFHDSEHSEACMRFEYEAAWPHLRPGGILVSDDITWNTAFETFAADVNRPVLRLARNIAFLIK